MKKIKFLALAAALVVCATASAQFSNVKRTGSSSSASAGLESGYHAFLEAGYVVGSGDVAADRIELSTSHGYQINPYVFVGGGLGISYYHSPDLWTMPIFINARGTLLDGPISPYLDLKIGYAVGLTSNDFGEYYGRVTGSMSGFYFSPSIGCRFNKFTVSAGYELMNYTLSNDYDSEGFSSGGFSFKIGMEF